VRGRAPSRVAFKSEMAFVLHPALLARVLQLRSLQVGVCGRAAREAERERQGGSHGE
jgi:hypothetical protein